MIVLQWYGRSETRKRANVLCFVPSWSLGDRPAAVEARWELCISMELVDMGV